MPRPATDKRERLAAAALDLAYRNGFEATSITEIASHAHISAGSVYFYFKTKHDVAAAILDTVEAQYGEFMGAWAALEDPRDRLLALVDNYARNSEQVSTFGCPVGAVVADLSKQGEAIAADAAAVMDKMVAGCAAQFEELEYPKAAARARAVHLVSVLQGAAALAKALGDPAVRRLETDHLVKWLRRP